MTLSNEIRKLTKQHVGAGMTVKELCQIFQLTDSGMRKRLQTLNLKAKREPSHKNPKSIEREQSICEMFQTSKMSLKQVGDKFGITRERVRQILKANGITERYKANFSNLYEQDISVWREKWINGMTWKEIAKEYNLLWNTISQLVARHSPLTAKERKQHQNNHFWRNVNITADHDQCWPWKTPIKNAFGSVPRTSYGKLCSLPAYKIAWIITNGKTDKWIIRQCESLTCVNPNHYKEGTPQDGIAKREQAYANGKERKKRKHLTKHELAAIRLFMKCGGTNQEVVKMYDISYSVAVCIRTGKRYANA